MSVLVTGGAGYIGSHVVRLLRERGDSVVVVDDMSNGILERIGDTPLVELDLTAAEAHVRLVEVMREHEVTAVIHFAAKKMVPESVARPMYYYRNNVTGLLNLLEAMEEAEVDTMVFSSSAAVYGMPDEAVVPEDIDCKPINPYGETKLVGEWLIDDARANGLKAIKLRYFNVAGAGWPELRDTATLNLIPIVFDRIRRGLDPIVFGDDYATADGTCIRDYVHVKDLAEAHISALDALAAGHDGRTTLNVGGGHGSSVLEVIDAIAEVTGRDITPTIEPRRAGDPPQLIADPTAIGQELVWKTSYSLREIVDSACPEEMRA